MFHTLIHVTVKNNFICLQFKFDQSVIAAIKTIPGRKWDGEQSSWLIPLSFQNWATLQELFPGRLDFSPEAATFPLRFHLRIKNYSMKTIQAMLTSGHRLR